MDMAIDQMMQGIGAAARRASSELAMARPDQKRGALLVAADEVAAACKEILSANEKDMAFGREKGLSPAMMDRLLLDGDRVQGMVDGLRAVANQDDPVGAVLAEWSMPSGLDIQRVRTPLGVIGVIFESRPNVTADAAALCLKAGNAAILRPGSEASIRRMRYMPVLRRAWRLSDYRNAVCNWCRHGIEQRLVKC